LSGGSLPGRAGHELGRRGCEEKTVAKPDETKQKFVQNNLDKGALKLGIEINV
jgi:hypothetical protein